MKLGSLGAIGPNILGAVDPTGQIVVVGIQSHGDGPTAVFVRQPIVVVPAVETVLVLGSVRPDAFQLDEGNTAVRGELPQSTAPVSFGCSQQTVWSQEKDGR
jgi:hypothetical protein